LIKYIKYFISTFTLLTSFIFCLQGGHYPLYVLIGLSLFIIVGDNFIKENMIVEKYSYPIILNFPIYINLFILLLFVSTSIALLSNELPIWMINIFENYFNLNLMNVSTSMSLVDKMAFSFLVSLFIGMMGTVPGHELTHRKKNKFDMFIGNWLLAFSWDCAFAIEHVYGHHKNVCLENDPASAKRGENVYMFILRAIINEQKDAWQIELDRLKRRNQNQFSLKNRMTMGYLRSLLLTLLIYVISGFQGVLIFLLCAFMAKALLEAINYIEHYGLVREPGKPVFPRHSWNSNHVISSLYLYNVTRHSSHHEKTNLKFWELETYPDSPTMPQGYLSILYLVIFLPFIYHRMMVQRLIDWDLNYATSEERKISLVQNKNSGIKKLIQHS